MTKHTQKINNYRLTAVVIVAVASFTAYDFFFMNNARAADTSAPSLVDPEMVVVNQLNSIRLDTSFFDNPAFASLQNDTVSVIPQPVGKINPFAPLSTTAQQKPVTTPAKTTKNTKTTKTN